MVYHNSDPLQKAKFLARTKYLAEKGRDVDLTELRPAARRSASQNACFHAWCALIADTIGEHDLDSVKRDVKRRILGVKKVRNVFTGKDTFEDYQTHLMTEEEMSDFLTKVKEWAQSTYGWWLPSREDPGFEEMIRMYGRR